MMSPKKWVDWIDPGNAPILAARIRDYWEKRGYLVDTWLIPLAAAGNGRTGVSIRSNMKGGFPVKKAARA